MFGHCNFPLGDGVAFAKNVLQLNCVSPSILFFNFPLHIPENRRKTGRHLLAYFETHAAGENLLPSKLFLSARVGWVGNEEKMGK